MQSLPILLKRPRFLAVLMLAALILAGGVQAIIVASRADASPSAPAAAPPPAVQTSIIIAATPLPPGHLIRPADLAEQPWPQGNPPPGAILAGSAEAASLAGAVTRRALAAGDYFNAAAVVTSSERGFLSAVVRPGHRAIAIAVDATTSASGLIWPGDRVDLILTQELRDDAVPLAQRVLAETILADVRVLAADQRLGPAGSEADKPAVPATVTLEVSPAAAERVTVAATLGRLHLALRPVGAAAAAEAPPAATWAGAVSPGLAGVRKAPPAMLSAPTVLAAAPPAPAPPAVRIYRGSSVETK